MDFLVQVGVVDADRDRANDYYGFHVNSFEGPQIAMLFKDHKDFVFDVNSDTFAVLGMRPDYANKESFDAAGITPETVRSSNNSDGVIEEIVYTRWPLSAGAHTC